MDHRSYRTMSRLRGLMPLALATAFGIINGADCHPVQAITYHMAQA